MPAFETRIVHADTEAGYWNAQAVQHDTTFVSQSAADLAVDKCTLRFNRTTTTGYQEDQATLSFHFGKIDTAGYVELGTTEFAALETALDAWWTTVKAQCANYVTLVEYSWHEVRADAPHPKGGVGQLTGPAVRRTSRSVAGSSGAARLPDQVAATVTFRTASRKHWGRVYIPLPAVSVLDTATARLIAGVQTSFANATRTLMTAANTASCNLVVWSPTHPAALTVRELVVDDVLDVIRRRRTKRSASRVALTS